MPIVIGSRGFKVFTLDIRGINVDDLGLDDLGQYLSDFAQLLGKDSEPRYHSIKRGSVKLAARVPTKHEVDVRTRTFLLRTGDAPEDAVLAKKRISHRLGVHRARRATVLDADKQKVIEIPIDRVTREDVEIPSLRKPGSLQGKVIRVGGKREQVSVDIEDVDGHVYSCRASRPKAKELAEHLFDQTVRVMGIGRWRSPGPGKWEVDEFHIDRFVTLDDDALVGVINELRSVQAEWLKRENPLEDLENIRDRGVDGL